MKRNIKDKCLVDQLKDSECIHIAVWKEGEVFKLYVNDIIAAESGDKQELKVEGHRIKKILNKQTDIKVKTNLH